MKSLLVALDIAVLVAFFVSAAVIAEILVTPCSALWLVVKGTRPAQGRLVGVIC